MKTVAIILIALMALYTLYFGYERHMANDLDRRQFFALVIQFSLCLGGIGLILTIHNWTKDLFNYDDDTDTDQ